jgi:hypothetical protein
VSLADGDQARKPSIRLKGNVMESLLLEFMVRVLVAILTGGAASG